MWAVFSIACAGNLEPSSRLAAAAHFHLAKLSISCFTVVYSGDNSYSIDLPKPGM